MRNRCCIVVVVVSGLLSAPSMAESICNGSASCADVLITPVSATGFGNDLSDPDNVRIAVGNSLVVEINVDGRSFPVVNLVAFDLWLEVVGGSGLSCADFSVNASRSDLLIATCSLCAARCTPELTAAGVSGGVDTTGVGGLLVDFLAYAAEMTLTCTSEGSFALEFGGTAANSVIGTTAGSGGAINHVDDPSHFESINVACIPPPTGGCCTSAGTICTTNVTEANCLASSGEYRGNGSNCSTPCAPPPPPGGACCSGIGCSSVSSSASCSDGSFFAGESCFGGFCTSADGTIGSGGGTVSTPDDSASVDFPAGCLSGDTAISMDWGNWPDRIFDVLVSGGPGNTLASYTFEPSGLDFCETAELCMTVNLARSGLTAADCTSVLFKFREGTCNGAPSTDCRSDGDCGAAGPCDFTFSSLTPSRPPDCSDPTRATFCANIGHFSDYGLLGPEGETIPAASTWGLLGLALALLVGAKVYFGRRRTMPA